MTDTAAPPSLADDEVATDEPTPTKLGSPERIKALLHLSRHAPGETIPAMAQILGLDEPVTRRLLNKLCDDQRLARDRSGHRLVYYSPFARAKLRHGGQV